jgi:hypothetical protein
LNDVLLRIKKEEGHNPKEVKANIKGHKKRNSDFQGGTGQGHRRRGSEGFF